MKLSLRNLLLIGAASWAISYGAINNALNKIFHKEEDSVYTYLVSQGINSENARILTPKINPELTNNEKEFARIISGYPSDLQRICVESDILDNRHISKAELESARRAGLERKIINPKEIYAIILNGDGSGRDPETYSQENTEYSLGNILAFYKYLKDDKVDDENISLLINNPTNVNLTDNATHDFFRKGGRFLTRKDGKTIFSDIPVNELLPVKTEEIVIDDISNKENFLESIKRLKTDYNDTLMIAFSDPGSRLLAPRPYDRDQKRYWQFNDSALGYNEFCYSITGLNYGKLIVIGNTPQAGDFLSNLEAAGPGYVFEDSKPPYIKNILAIESPNTLGFYNETWMLRLLSRQRENPERTIENLLEIGKETGEEKNNPSRSYFYNKMGRNRPLQECSELYEPLVAGNYQ